MVSFEFGIRGVNSSWGAAIFSFPLSHSPASVIYYVAARSRRRRDPAIQGSSASRFPFRFLPHELDHGPISHSVSQAQDLVVLRNDMTGGLAFDDLKGRYDRLVPGSGPETAILKAGSKVEVRKSVDMNKYGREPESVSTRQATWAVRIHAFPNLSQS